jgi:hypothetical protein
MLFTLYVCCCTVLLASSRDSDGGSKKYIVLFIRGKAMCGAPSIGTISPFPNQPIEGVLLRRKLNGRHILSG